MKREDNAFVTHDRAIDTISRSSLTYWIIGGLIISLGLMAVGTDITYSLLIFLFTFLTGITFESVGGLRTIAGACVTYLALQHVLVSQVAKILYLQPADDVLLDPIRTAGVYCAGMASLAVAAVLARRAQLLSKQPLFKTSLNTDWLRAVALIAIPLSTIRIIVIALFGMSEDNQVVVGGILGPIKTMYVLTALSIAASTAYCLKKYDGRKSLCGLNITAIAIPFCFAMTTATRADMAFAVVTYLVTCLSYGFKFRSKHVSVFLVSAVFAEVYLFPYALAARDVVRTGNVEKNITAAWDLLADVVQDPFKYREQQTRTMYFSSDRRRVESYYHSRNSTLNRYSVIIYVDAIVFATEDKGASEWKTITPGFQMLLPRFLSEDKPVYSTANLLAHKAKGDTLVGRKDEVTQITLGIFADSYSSFRWLGVLIIPGVLFFALIASVQYICDCRFNKNIFVIALASSIPWRFSEGTIGSNLVMIVQGGLVLCFVLCVVVVLVRFSKRLLPAMNRFKS